MPCWPKDTKGFTLGSNAIHDRVLSDGMKLCMSANATCENKVTTLQLPIEAFVWQFEIADLYAANVAYRMLLRTQEPPNVY